MTTPKNNSPETRDPASWCSLRKGRMLLSPMPVTITQKLDMVLSLTETDEFPKETFDMLKNGPWVWAHHPIADLNTPDLNFENGWPRLVQNMLGRLDQAQSIMIHCKAGCGRTGMIALRLMIEAGEDPDAALHRLRKARPCAIETQAQMNWAKEV